MRFTRCNKLAASMLLVSPAAIHAATIEAPSPSWSHVSNAVASATHGDVISIPAGVATWGGELTITKAVSFIGAGASLTKIGGAANLFAYYVEAAGSNVPFRISGIGFTNVTGFESILISGANGVEAARVDRCTFDGGTRAIHNWKKVWAVIDHCSFTNCNIAIGQTGDNNAAWLRSDALGTTNMVVVEDCTFGLPPSTTLAHQIYNQTGARVAVRNCQFLATTGDPYFIEAHGNQNYYTGTGADFRGTVSVEAYRNSFQMGINNNRWTYFRGGQILLFSNVFSDLSGSTPLMQLTEEEGWQTSFFSPLRTNWPAQDQITNSFFWGNTRGGSNLTTYLIQTNSTNFIQENRDFWMQAPNATNGSPAGVLQTYTPLVYPHPLVTAQDGGGGTLTFSAPATARSATVGRIQ